MQAFIFICILTVACAEKLGYNYQPVSHSDFGLSFAPGLLSGFNDEGAISTSSLGSGSYGDFSGVSDGTSGVSGGSSGVSGSHDGSFVDYAPQVELEKEFYTFTANEDDFNEPAIQSQLANSARNNLRVIFIKGPENHALENAAVALAKHTAEQKTDIYVLHKQADVSSLSQKLNSINNNINNKPEVHFVKYRTPEDAVNAQKAIQSQYDSLGDNSQSYIGGVAPVLNFASKLTVPAHVSHGSSTGSVGSIVGSHGSYATAGSVSLGSVGTHDITAPSKFYVPSTVNGVTSVPSSNYLPSLVARYRK